MISAQDYSEMCQVSALCMHLVDSKEWGRLNEVFTIDCFYDGTNTLTKATADGVAAIAELWSKLPMGVHGSTDFIVTDIGPDGLTAQSVSKWTSTPDNDHLRTGDYVDEWKRTSDGWRISRRTNSIRRPDPPK